MTSDKLFSLIQERKSYLCVGLDSDPDKIPAHLAHVPDPILTFNKAIIDATRDFCVAYKPNIAFYEALGADGWRILEATIQYIGKEHLVIADAKRGDIGNTSRLYAKAFFETLDADALTIAPYMGKDSVSPFLGFDNKWVIILGLTSNPGSNDFQMLQLENQKKLYEQVLESAATWAGPDELMFVVGATHPENFKSIRSIVPDYFFLVPGVGAQGGDLHALSQYGMNAKCGLLVNSTRGIIYAGSGLDYAEKARKAAKALQVEMEGLLKRKGLIE